VVLIVLAVLWGIVLGPWAVQVRAEQRRMRSVENFRRHLRRLAPTTPGPRASRPSVAARPSGAARPVVSIIASAPVILASAPVAVPTPAPVAVKKLSRASILRRRQRILAGLIVAVATTLVVGAFPGLRLAWAANGMADLALVAYLIGLRRLHRLALERKAKVRYLPATEVTEAEVIEDLPRPVSSSIG
jgi:hypothetical protein